MRTRNAELGTRNERSVALSMCTNEFSHCAFRVPRLNVPRSAFRVRHSMGFTLLELMVATILLTIVMTTIYTSFNSALNAWRLGDTNVTGLQEARTAISIFERELQSAMPKAAHLFAGDATQIEFCTLATPMNPQHAEVCRPLWVRYSLNGRALIREERTVEGVIDNANPDATNLGEPYRIELALNVEQFKISYQWLNPTPPPSDFPPPPLPPINFNSNEKGAGQPQGMQVELTINDPNTVSDKATFTSGIVFRGPTTPYDASRHGGQS